MENLIEINTGDPNWKVRVVEGEKKHILAEIEKDKKVRGQKQLPKPKKPLLTNKPNLKPKSFPRPVKTNQQKINAIMQIAAKNTTRYAINRLLVDGEKIIAIDGRRLFILKGKKGQWGNDGVYNVVKGKLTNKIEGTFPSYNELIPPHGPDNITAKIILTKTIGDLRRATIMTSVESKGVSMVLNPDGTLGFSSISPEIGSAEINIQDGYTTLCGINPLFLIHALEFHLKTGDTKINLWFIANDKPIITENIVKPTFFQQLETHATTITMPVKINQ